MAVESAIVCLCFPPEDDKLWECTIVLCHIPSEGAICNESGRINSSLYSEEQTNKKKNDVLLSTAAILKVNPLKDLFPKHP